MIQYFYSIYDSKAEAYMNPFMAQNDGTALREFGNIARDKEHPVGRHPEDYSLWLVARWNMSSGKMQEIQAKCLINAISVGIEGQTDGE